MTRTILATTVAAVALLSGAAAIAENASQPLANYNVVTPLADPALPTSFSPVQAASVEGGITQSVVTSMQRIQSDAAPFLKRGVVTSLGDSDAWELSSDEGNEENGQTAPNPLTYFAAGIASDLLTQVERSAEVLGLEIDDAKVEVKIWFRYIDTMSAEWSGYTDKVETNIIIDSDASPEDIARLKELAVQSWAVGEALANETTIDAAILSNPADVGVQPAQPGVVRSPVSVADGFQITGVTAPLNLATVEVNPDLVNEGPGIPDPMLFTEVGIAESADNPDRPYLHKIRAKSLTAFYETWEFYADDGPEGDNAIAPSSWDYFSIGTSNCLMSQLTAAKFFYDFKGTPINDFWVEHQFDYTLANHMTPDATGSLGTVVTRIVVDTEAGTEVAQAYGKQALTMCFAGEGIQNATEMVTGVYLNGAQVE